MKLSREVSLRSILLMGTHFSYFLASSKFKVILQCNHCPLNGEECGPRILKYSLLTKIELGIY